MKLLVDTSVFLDLFWNRDNQEAKRFFQFCLLKRNQLYITSQSLRDIEYTIKRLTHDSNIAKNLQMTAYSSCHKVIGISADAAIESLYSDVKDYEDSLQIEAAKESMLDAIITSNKKDFVNCGIPVFTPKEINDVWAKQKQ